MWPWRVAFDLAAVRVLADDEDRLLRRLDVGVRSGWIEVAEARRAIGLPVDDSHRIFLRPLNVQATPAAEPPAEAGNNGSPQVDAREIAREVVAMMSEES